MHVDTGCCPVCPGVTHRGWVVVATLTLSVVFSGLADAQSLDTQPNIIVFLVDDLGWQDTGVAFSGKESVFQDHFQTPHVNRLAQRGIRFVNAYAHCVCSPTRTSIMTGQNPARHHVTNWTLYPKRDSSGKTARLVSPKGWRLEGIQSDKNKLPALLRGAGYRTIHCGKAHWGAVGTPGSDPCRLGFDVNIAGHSAGAPGSYQGSDNFGNHKNGDPNPPWGVPGLEKYYGTDIHLTDALATEACAAIDQAVTDRKPFFLYMAPYAVHTPVQSHSRFVENYRGKMYAGTEIDIPDVEADYASMVEGYDAALGLLLDKLNQLNVADKTIVLFTSDNGGLSVHTRGRTARDTGKNTHCWPLREGKGSAYEGGIRVPMIVSWATPDSGSALQKNLPFPKNSTTDAFAISEDIFPTVCRWAGVNVSKTTGLRIDGVDITDSLINKGETPHRMLLFHYPHVWGPKGDGYQPHSSLRNGKWKIIYFYDSRSWELYDLESDIGESDNRADREPALLRKMKTMLIRQLENHDAQYPIVIATGKPEKPE